MRSTLDKLVQPGERVVFQTALRGRVLGRALIPVIILVCAFTLLGTLAYAVFVGRNMAFFFSTLCLLGLLPSVFLSTWLERSEAIVTNRRLLYDRGPVAWLWSWKRVYDIPHTEIAEIKSTEEGSREALALRLADGLQLDLPVPNKRGLAEALAVVTGLPLMQGR